MAVVSANEIRGRKVSRNALWQRFYTRRFRIITDDPATDGATVMAAAGLPAIGNTYSANGVNDYGAFVNSIVIDEEGEDGKSWIATVEYGPYDANTFPGSPMDWPLRLRFTTNKLERVIWADRNGNAILNSAYDPFKDPIAIDDSRTIITATRNELISSFDLTLADSYKDKINASTWNGFAAETVKCSNIETSDPQLYTTSVTIPGAIYYYAVTYTFEINRDTWAREILDQGFTKLDGSTPKKRLQITDKYGQPITEAVPLDGSGGELATNGTPVFLTKDVYPTADFSVFNMDFATALGRS